jgi:succinyl-CoA:acetate CoA-transferase
VTEQGLADLRGLDPREKGETIIRQCAHPDFKAMLSDYLARASREVGHIPLLLEESRAFHARLKRSGTMKEEG